MSGTKSAINDDIFINKKRNDRLYKYKMLLTILLTNIFVYMIASPTQKADIEPKTVESGNVLIKVPLNIFVPIQKGLKQKASIYDSNHRLLIREVLLRVDLAAPEITDSLDGDEQLVLVELKQTEVEIIIKNQNKALNAYPMTTNETVKKNKPGNISYELSI